jgi:hypothetical protein
MCLQLSDVDLLQTRPRRRCRQIDRQHSRQALDEDAADVSEANALDLDLLFSETTIPVLRVHRDVKRQWDSFIAMDYIPGPMLAHVWPTFST